MKKTALLLTAFFLFMLSACTNIGFEKTKSGLEYKIISGSSEGEKLAVGDIIKVHYRVTFKDSMIDNSYDFLPAYAQVDSVGLPYDISEIFTTLFWGLK